MIPYKWIALFDLCPSTRTLITGTLLLLMFVIGLPASVRAADSLEKVTLQLKWKHQFQFAGYYAAVEKGFYAEEGLDVEIKEGKPNLFPIEELVNGSANYGIAGSEAILQRIKGRPIVLLAAIFQHSPRVLAVRKDSGIDSVQDLVGKSVALGKKVSALAEIYAMLLAEHVPLEKLNLIESWDLQNLISGKVDAYSCYLTVQPYELKLKKFPYSILKPTTYGIDFYGDCLITSEDEIQKHQERATAFKKASLRGWQYAMAHPDEMITLILKKYTSPSNIKTHDQLAHEAHEMHKLIRPNLIEIGHINPGRLRHIAETYAELGLIGSAFSLDGFIYNEYRNMFDWDHWALKTLAAIIALILITTFILIFFIGKLKQEVAERQRVENALRISENHYRSLTQSSLTGIYIHVGGIFKYVNDRFAQLLGYSVTEIIGKVYWDFVHPDDREMVRGISLARAQGEDVVPQYEYRHITKSGSTLWVFNSATIIQYKGQTANMGNIVDITPRKQAEEMLKQNEAFTQAALDNLPIGVAVNSVDPNVHFEYMNDNFPRFYRTTREALADPDYFWEAVYEDEDFREAIKEQVLGDIASGDPSRMHWDDVPITRSGLETRYISARNTSIPGDALMISTVWDETDRKRTEQALKDTLSELERSEREQTALFIAGRGVLKEDKFQVITRQIFDAASELIGSTAGYVALLSDDGKENELLFLEAGGRPCSVNPDLPMPIRGLRAESYKTGEVVYENEFHNSQWMDYMPAGHVRLDNVMFAPLNIGDQTAGIMGLANKEGGFNDKDAYLAMQFAELAAIALNKSRLISEITSANTRLRALWNVSSLKEADTQTISDHVLESLAEMTGSDFGFYGFLNEDESVMTIHSWSGKAMDECSLVDKPQHFPIKEAGIWAEAVRRREPFILNNYGQDHPAKKGLPDGHVNLTNILVVPHFSKDRIVSMAAVANRDRLYAQDDITQIQSFLTSAQAIFDARIAVEATKKSEAALSKAQRVARIGSWWYDPVTQQPEWTEEMFHVFGLEPANQAPHYEEHKKLIHPDDWVRFDNAVARAVSEGIGYNLELRVIRPDGEVGYINAICEPETDDTGTVVRLVGTTQDISLIKRGEIQRKELETQLRQAQKMEAVGTLAGGIAHDFNNILAAISGYTELLLDDIPEQRPYYQHAKAVLKASRRAKDLVRQILSFSRQTEHEMRPIRLRPVVNDALKLLRSTIPTTIDIEKYLPAESSIVLGDPTQIHQVIMNLGTNAAHAMKDNGGLLTVLIETIQIDDAMAKQFLKLEPGTYQKLTVKDSGHGMDQETLDKIFNPFYTTKEIGEGTGMGLSVVHGIVEEHHGEITVSSQLGRGTTFNIFLPVTDTPDEGEQEIRASFPKGSESVLLVDDEKPLADFGRQMLERLGYKVTVKTSSLEALDVFKANPDNFDLIFTDMTMPKMTGLNLAKEITHIKPDIPVILCTGFSNQVDEENYRSFGVKRLLLKPVSKKDAAYAIRELLDG